MISLMSPGLKAAMHARFAGFSYSELPAKEQLPDGVKIDKIGGKGTAEIEWPTVTFYRPVSRRLFVRYETKALVWTLRFSRYVYSIADQ